VIASPAQPAKPLARIKSSTSSAGLATELRAGLGEQEATLKKYDMPRERAATPIPAALKLYEQARRMLREKRRL
jgi:hypothetical protein